MKIEKLKILLKREYLRGQIDRSNGRYSYESLNRRYNKYLEDNPSIKDDIQTFFDDINK